MPLSFKKLKNFNMNPNTKKLLTDTIETCLKSKCNFKISAKDHVIIDGIKCSGWYDESDLVVAGGKKEWLDVLVHESCHMDQFLEGYKYWKRGDDSLSMIDKWLAGKRKTRNELVKATKDVIMLELDCERRAVQKMKKYKIPFNAGLYTQKANSYLFGYWATLRDRKWFAFPYEQKKIYGKMPKVFLEPKEYLNNYEKFLSLYV